MTDCKQENKREEKSWMVTMFSDKQFKDGSGSVVERRGRRGMRSA